MIQQEENSAMFISTVPSPLGSLTLASDGEALTGLWIEGQKYAREMLANTDSSENAVPCTIGCERELRGKAQFAPALPVLRQAEQWLDAYFQGKSPVIDFPLAPQGSEFRRQVWQILQKIPYGELTTYGAIARELERVRGSRVSAQAVGGAVGHNPISILIPCHRVVGSNGSLTGYAGGLEKKIFLLELEGFSSLFHRRAPSPSSAKTTKR